MNEKTLKRPIWGTILGVLNILGLIVMGLVIVTFLLLSLGAISAVSLDMEQTMPGFGMMLAMGWAMLIPLILVFTFNIIVTVGIFKGKRWTIILSIIFASLGVIGALLGKPFNILPVILNSAVLGLAIMCIKDPFYAKK